MHFVQALVQAMFAKRTPRAANPAFGGPSGIVVQHRADKARRAKRALVRAIGNRQYRRQHVLAYALKRQEQSSGLR